MLRNSKKIIWLSLVIFFIASLPTVSSAQFNLGGFSSFADELGVEISPTYPRPNQSVYINLSLYTGDLSSAEISWYENGKLASEGTGQTSHSFVTGEAGKSTSIEIRVELLGGPSFSKSFTIIPASVDLVWESDSYVPPFYKGKALHPRQGDLKIVAMPEFVKSGTKISPSKLIYEWSNDTQSYQSQSGYGKNVLTLSGNFLGREERVQVLVRDPSSNMVAINSITIAPTEPQVVFYENNPYYGYIFDSAMKNTFSLENGEVQVVAAPLYFSNGGADLDYGWRLNNSSIQELSESRTAIFRKPEEGSGRSAISLNIGSPGKILQQASGGVVIEFDN